MIFLYTHKQPLITLLGNYSICHKFILKGGNKSFKKTCQGGKLYSIDVIPIKHIYLHIHM